MDNDTVGSFETRCGADIWRTLLNSVASVHTRPTYTLKKFGIRIVNRQIC